MADAQALGFHLLLQVDARLDRCQSQVANRARVLHFAHPIVFDYANAALAVTQFELNQTHGFSPVNKTAIQRTLCRSWLASEDGGTSNINVD
ncbi:hypothetical protein D3C86_1780580 [compost metagenome]